MRLAGLARRWGFKDASRFNRAFRQTFKISPGQARAAALGGITSGDFTMDINEAPLGRWIAQICAARPTSTPAA